MQNPLNTAATPRDAVTVARRWLVVEYQYDRKHPGRAFTPIANATLIAKRVEETYPGGFRKFLVDNRLPVRTANASLEG